MQILALHFCILYFVSKWILSMFYWSLSSTILSFHKHSAHYILAQLLSKKNVDSYVVYLVNSRNVISAESNQTAISFGYKLDQKGVSFASVVGLGSDIKA